MCAWTRHTKHMPSRVPVPYARERPIGLTLCSNESRSACAAVQSSPPTFLQQAGETLSAEGRLATLLLEFERLALEFPNPCCGIGGLPNGGNCDYGDKCKREAGRSVQACVYYTVRCYMQCQSHDVL